MRDMIDSAVFTEMLLCAADALELNKQSINELNVFPVPDGDTGTNMSLTMNNAATELRKKKLPTVTAVADTAASALLRGARGNSGVILSLLFRGISKGLKGKETATAADFAKAMTDGVEAAYKAVMKPTEGTILTVSRMAAAAAVEFAEAGSDFELMLVCALESARDALEETVEQNPVLKRAGVVDAGGKGYVTILDAMLASLQGRVVASEAPVQAATHTASAAKADFSEFDTGEITFGYCTELIIKRENDKSPDLLRAYFESLGDCVLVVDDDEIIKTHCHVNDPGKVLSEGLTYGQLLAVKVDNMRQQHTTLNEESRAFSEVEEAPAENTVAEPEKPFGSVVVCAGDGMAQLFTELGADGIISGGQTMNPSTEDILKVINATPAETVFVFPNNKNIIMAAQQCQPLTDKKVVVVPTTTVPQGISALLMMDSADTAEALTEAFTEAASGVHTAQVTYAARDSDIDGHDIHAGEYLALMDGALVGSYTDQAVMAQAVADAIKAVDPSLITVYYGEDVKEADAEKISDIIGKDFPDAEISLINGGQPVYYYMISAE